ncbi:hypothetical protein ILP92_17090 [Maribius pontilimi]|uniref:Uncharacterized protein n=1 Tax=Palleronia pontilimi TaxID=1964209 RepID=A0A934IC68_9RHOB|nr:hypothetical protein [Palleronia pontilimi]MBJ3764454.1 hypothetical protein [Palleronia pontilimi]
MTAVLSRKQGVPAADAVIRAAGFELLERSVLGDGPDPDRIAYRRGAERLDLIRDLASGAVLVVRQPDGPLLDGLVPMEAPELRALLTAPKAADRLAGVQAAEALADARLMPELIRACADPEPAVASRAAAALRALAERQGGRAVDPGEALFALPGWRREKLQMLRWWMAEPPGDPPTIAGAVARALKDPDWEIAVTAMLAAGRLRLLDLGPALARLRPPSGRRLGLAGQEPRLLLALRDACLTRLGHPAGKPLPPGVAQAVAGDFSSLAADFVPFVASLVLPLQPPQPPVAARGVTQASEGPRLADGTLLAWVPPGNYWLGDPHLRGPEPNPVRRVTLAAGFYIDARPRGLASYAAAEDAARTLSGKLGRPVALPDPEQWEIAARGTDGRRFPWGANGAPDVRVDLSPAGMSDILKGPGEWLAASATAEGRLLAGGAAAPVPAARRRTSGKSANSFRFVYVI